MATLTSAGINFSDATKLESKYGIIPKSSATVFYMSSAPTGWTKSSTPYDHALRVVSGSTGGTASGSTAFSSIFPTSYRPISVPGVPMSGSVGNHTLTTPQLPNHGHANGGSTQLNPGGGDVSSGGGWSRSSTNTAGAGGDQAHNHPWSGSCNFTASFDMRIRYIDVILCTFN